MAGDARVTLQKRSATPFPAALYLRRAVTVPDDDWSEEETNDPHQADEMMRRPLRDNISDAVVRFMNSSPLERLGLKGVRTKLEKFSPLAWIPILFVSSLSLLVGYYNYRYQIQNQSPNIEFSNGDAD